MGGTLLRDAQPGSTKYHGQQTSRSRDFIVVGDPTHKGRDKDSNQGFARSDAIPNEAYKAGINTTVTALHPLFKKILQEERVLEDWKQNYLVKLAKKEIYSSVITIKDIMLQPTANKIFNQIILEGMKSTIYVNFRGHQVEFRKERLCTDRIARLRIIVKQFLAWNSSLLVIQCTSKGHLTALTGNAYED